MTYLKVYRETSTSCTCLLHVVIEESDSFTKTMMICDESEQSSGLISERTVGSNDVVRPVLLTHY